VLVVVPPWGVMVATWTLFVVKSQAL